MSDDKPKPYTLAEQEDDFRVYGYGTRDRHRATVEALEFERAANWKWNERCLAIEDALTAERAAHAKTLAFCDSLKSVIAKNHERDLGLLERAEKAEKERDEFKRIGQQFEADSRKHFEQGCLNLARAEELANRLHDSEQGAAAMREALKGGQGVHGTTSVVSAKVVAELLSSTAGRAFVRVENLEKVRALISEYLDNHAGRELLERALALLSVKP